MHHLHTSQHIHYTAHWLTAPCHIQNTNIRLHFVVRLRYDALHSWWYGSTYSNPFSKNFRHYFSFSSLPSSASSRSHTPQTLTLILLHFTSFSFHIVPMSFNSCCCCCCRRFIHIFFIFFVSITIHRYLSVAVCSRWIHSCHSILLWAACVVCGTIQADILNYLVYNVRGSLELQTELWPIFNSHVAFYIWQIACFTNKKKTDT